MSGAGEHQGRHQGRRQGGRQGDRQEALFDVAQAAPVSSCGICGRALYNPLSVYLGIGPVCRGGRGGFHTNEGGETLTDLTDGHIGVPTNEGFVIERDGDEKRVYTNVPHLIVHHSPTGFEFGYAGSGPADLALNICALLVRGLGLDGGTKVRGHFEGEAPAEAFAIYQDFKFRFVAPLDGERGGTIDYHEASDWVRRRLEDPEVQLRATFFEDGDRG